MRAVEGLAVLCFIHAEAAWGVGELPEAAPPSCPGSPRHPGLAAAVALSRDVAPFKTCGPGGQEHPRERALSTGPSTAGGTEGTGWERPPTPQG